MAITKEDARFEVIKLWHRWWEVQPKTSVPDSAEGSAFYNYLETDEAYLLQFPPSGSKWFIVHTWLRGARLLAD